MSAITKLTDDPLELRKAQLRLDGIDMVERKEELARKRPPKKWFDMLRIRPADYPDLKLNHKEKLRINLAHVRTRTGIASQVPMTCPSRQHCAFAKGWATDGGHCEYAKIKKEPVGKPCIVEMDLIAERTAMYAAQFEVGDSPEETIDRLQCMELAEYDVYERRVTILLGDEDKHELTEENVIGVDDAEQPIYAKQVALAWNLKNQIKNRRDKVLQSLVATRREKYKRQAALGKAEDGEGARGFSGIMGKFAKMMDGESPVITVPSKDASEEA